MKTLYGNFDSSKHRYSKVIVTFCSVANSSESIKRLSPIVTQNLANGCAVTPTRDKVKVLSRVTCEVVFLGREPWLQADVVLGAVRGIRHLRRRRLAEGRARVGAAGSLVVHAVFPVEVWGSRGTLEGSLQPVGETHEVLVAARRIADQVVRSVAREVAVGDGRRALIRAVGPHLALI